MAPVRSLKYVVITPPGLAISQIYCILPRSMLQTYAPVGWCVHEDETILQYGSPYLIERTGITSTGKYFPRTYGIHQVEIWRILVITLCRKRRNRGRRTSRTRKKKKKKKKEEEEEQEQEEREKQEE